MVILVTGANVFVGRSLYGQLTRYGFAVRAAVRHKCSFDECNGFEYVVIDDIGPDTNWEKTILDLKKVNIH